MTIVLQDGPSTSVREATCVLQVAHAKKAVCLAQQLLIQRRIEESAVRMRLYRIRAMKASKRLDEAHLDVGRARMGVGQARRQLKGVPSVHVTYTGKREFIYLAPVTPQ